MKTFYYDQANKVVEAGETAVVVPSSSDVIHHDKKAVLISGDADAVSVMVRIGNTMVNWCSMTAYVSSVGTGTSKITYVNIPFPCSRIEIIVNNTSGAAIHVSYYGGAA